MTYRSTDRRSLYEPRVPIRRKRVRKRNTRRALILLVSVTLAGALTGLAVKKLSVSANDVVTVSAVKTPMPTPSGKSTRRAAAVPKQTHTNTSTAAIKDALQKVIDAHPELQIAISFTNLKNNEHISISGDTSFTAASSTKLITALTFLTQVEQGKHSLEEEIGDYTAQDQLQMMINQSNNDSWAYFNDMLGYPAQDTYAQQIGITTYQSDQNVLSADDMTSMLNQLYSGKLLNADHTQLLLSYMENTVDEEYLPAALPPGASVYHKYGVFEDNVHDSGIVVEKDQTYIVSIFTNGKGFYNYDQRVIVFANLVDAIEANL